MVRIKGQACACACAIPSAQQRSLPEQRVVSKGAPCAGCGALDQQDVPENGGAHFLTCTVRAWPLSCSAQSSPGGRRNCRTACEAKAGYKPVAL